MRRLRIDRSIYWRNPGSMRYHQEVPILLPMS